MVLALCQVGLVNIPGYETQKFGLRQDIRSDLVDQTEFWPDLEYKIVDQTKFWTDLEYKTERLSSLEKFMQIITQTKVCS